MQICEQCPSNPSCNECAAKLHAGEMAKKVIPPRPVVLTHLATGQKLEGELRAISRLSLGIFLYGQWESGRHEIELAADFRIIGVTGTNRPKSSYVVFDIEKVLRKEEVFERLLMEEFHIWHLSTELEPTSVLTEFPVCQGAWKEQVKQELEKLHIMKHLGDIHMFVAEGEELRSLGEFTLDESMEREIRRMVKKVQDSSKKVREQLFPETLDQVYDITVVPLQPNTCGVALINITDIITAERERRMEEWRLYKSVLSIVTGNKLELLQDDELYSLIRGSDHQTTVPIKESTDLSRVRLAIKQALSFTDLSVKRILHFAVAVNEAATNTLKHGIGGFVKIYICPKEEKCRVVVFDEGKGIELMDLPKAALMKGYSSTESLGVGFHVMLTYADKIYLNSSQQGTKIVLELHNIHAK